MKKLWLSLATALSLAASLPAQEAAAPAPAPTPAEQPLTLEACYKEAIANSPILRAARSNFEAATGAKLELDAIALPVVNIGGIGGQQGPRHGTPGSTKKDFFLITGNLTQPIFNGAIPATFRRGRLDLALAEQQFNRSLLTEVYILRIAFYKALQAREGIAVQESIQTLLKANLKSLQDQLTVGKVSRMQVGQAEQQLEALTPGINAAHIAYRTAQLTLAQHLGRDLSAANAETLDSGLPVPAGTLEAVSLKIDYPSDTAYALKHRPDLIALRLLVEATKDDITIADAGYLPRLNFISNFQLIPQKSIAKSGTITQPGDEQETTELLFGPSFTWIPIDGGAIHGEMTVLGATRDSYEIDLKQLESDVPRQLVQVAGALDEFSAQLEGSEQNVALADQNLKQVEAQVANGDRPQLDFLNAQSNLLQARFNRLNALLANNTAVAQFDIITGRYLEFVSKIPAPATTP